MIHRVHIWKQYLQFGTNDERTPWKWKAQCTCGWTALSWSWDRRYDLLTSGMTEEAYLAEGNKLVGGVLQMTNEHLSEVAERLWGWRHLVDMSTCVSHPDSFNFTRIDDMILCSHGRWMVMVEVATPLHH